MAPPLYNFRVFQHPSYKYVLAVFTTPLLCFIVANKPVLTDRLPKSRCITCSI